MFKFIKPRSVCLKKSKSGEEVLECLKNYFESHIGEPIEFLVRFWKDQQNVITYEELRNAILQGYLGEDLLKQWQQDYSFMVANSMNTVWGNSMKAGNYILENKYGFIFNTADSYVQSWISTHGAEFITNVTAEQTKAINTLISRAVAGEYTVDELARVIRPCIGLSTQQANANLKYYNHVKERLRSSHPKMNQKKLNQKAEEAAIKYASKQQRYRAQTIAQTELAFAYNKGAQLGIKQAQSKGLIGYVVKKWNTAGDKNVCSVCRALDGTVINIDAEFDFPGKELFQGHKLTPPAHPHCACAIEYVEMNTPLENPSSGLSADDRVEEVEPHDPPKMVEKLDHIDDEVIESKLKEYEKYIALDNEKENAIVITKDGEVWRCYGTKARVYPEELGDKLYGSSITHNHPSSVTEYSFSGDDIRLFNNYNLKILRGIDDKYIYVLSRNVFDIDVDEITIFERALMSDEEIREYATHAENIFDCGNLGIGYRRYKRE